ncbi:MAG: class I SAM-dependent methyltransferase [Planctomycetia bacterium]|nr:class I SAM-dependent methyltransferase [Planctomycetia bacterium]
MICRVCDSNDLEAVLDLGEQPWCNHFLKPEEAGTEPHYPLRLVYCHNCSTTQLDFTVKKEVMFGDHTYLSGVTKSLSEHFRQVAMEVDIAMNERTRKSVLDIGSNDGTQLKHFQALGNDVLGVESSKTTAALANTAGVPTINAFFNRETARSIGRKFDVINAAGVFFHLEELHCVTDAIRECLKPDGIFVVQFLYMKKIIENLAFDQIYHEHLLYYNLHNLSILLARHGLQLHDCFLAPIHGGSMIAFASHAGARKPSARLTEYFAAEGASKCNDIATYRRFAECVREVKQRDVAFLDDCRSREQRVFGMGAPVKGNTLLNYFGIGRDRISCLVEKNRLRKGLVSPGMHIPVVMEDELETPPDVYYVLAWNFKHEILANNKHLIDRGVQFYFPVHAEAA